MTRIPARKWGIPRDPIFVPAEAILFHRGGGPVYGREYVRTAEFGIIVQEVTNETTKNRKVDKKSDRW
jgi:hypothetical protein